MKRLLPLALLSLLATTAFAETLDQLYAQFREEARTELKSALDKDDAQNNNRLIRLESLIVEGLPADTLEDANPRVVLRTLAQIRTITRAPKVEALAQKLVDEMRKVKERKEKEFGEKFTGTLREAAEAMMKATKPADLDAPLGIVQRAQKEATQSMQEDGTRTKGVDLEQAQALQQLMTMWQDAIQSLTAPALGRNQLEALESNLSSYTRNLNEVVPRSVMIDSLRTMRQRVQPNAPKRLTATEVDAALREITRGVAKLDDLAPAVAKIEAMNTQQRELMTNEQRYYASNSNSESSLLVALRAQRKNYEDLKAGMAVPLATLTTAYSGAQDEIAPIRALLIKAALPRALGSDDQPPTEAESATAYLARTLDRARNDRNWVLLTQVLETAQTLNLTVVAANDATALRQMLAGVNLERARQFSSAVAAYLQALKSGSQVIPAEWIGEKLDAIRKAMPEDFAQGQKMPTAALGAEIRDAGLAQFPFESVATQGDGQTPPILSRPRFRRLQERISY